MTERTKIAVAVSGGGRTLANLLEKQNASDAKFEVTCVITSRSDCGGVTIAKEAGLPLFCHKFPSAHDASLTSDLEKFLIQHGVEWVILGGFLRPWPALRLWKDRTINIHPALLPKFGGKGMYGMHVHEAVLREREIESGATVHFVTERYDEGAIIGQIKVPTEGAADAKALAVRVFAAERKLYPEVINKLVSGALPLPSGQIFTMKAT